MLSGLLRHRLILQSRSTATLSGDPSYTWFDKGTRWCSVEPLSGRDMMIAKQIHADATVRIRMRFMTGITGKDRLKWDTIRGTRYFEILHVQDTDERHAELVLTCREVTT